jgi:diaminopimelate decarboxylase
MFRDNFLKNNTPQSTPAYVYDLGLLDQTLQALYSASGRFDYKIHYALKANYNPEILRLISSYGFGADCVSGNEMKRAIECGFTAGSIAFAGVGKTDPEITYAVKKDIFGLNCESEQELEIINKIAAKLGKKASVYLRINPDVEADTHQYITTGLADNKFGMAESSVFKLLDSRASFEHVEIMGLHFHIGSQITSMEPFLNLCLTINEIQDKLAKRGIVFDHLNVGGGLGIDYDQPTLNPIPDFKRFFQLFNKYLSPPKAQTVHFELGRSIVGQCGTLLSRVVYLKESKTKTFVIIDAAMTDLIRPALYNAVHKIENLSNQEKTKSRYDVVGPVCESSDTFARDVELSAPRRGDIIAIYSAGAYGQVMSSNYNLRSPARTYYINHPLAQEVQKSATAHRRKTSSLS